jgi:hypothetical protein
MNTEKRQEVRIVTRAKGSWKWQNAYGVVAYAPYVCKNGNIVWKPIKTLVQKASWPQLRRAGYTGIKVGSLYNRPV